VPILGFRHSYQAPRRECEAAPSTPPGCPSALYSLGQVARGRVARRNLPSGKATASPAAKITSAQPPIRPATTQSGRWIEAKTTVHSPEGLSIDHERRIGTGGQRSSMCPRKIAVLQDTIPGGRGHPVGTTHLITDRQAGFQGN
jgi:hypothetical protein